MHNAAYEALGIDHKFVFTAAHVDESNLQQAIEGARALGIRGITVTIPHKINVLQYLDTIDEVAQKIGAVNTIVNENGKLAGYNTDWIGVKASIERAIGSAQGKKAAVLGAGGAARGVVYGLMQAGAKVTVFNRTQKAAEEIARDFDCAVASLEELDKVKDMDIIMNSTPLGMGDHKDKTPLPAEYIRKEHVIFDAVYIPYETRLLRDAKESGATIIHGLDMLLHQGTAQFTYYTGKPAPEDVMKKILLDHALHQ
jgi:shikimate dehydrogenase